MNSVSAHLPFYLSKSPLKWDFLDIYLTTLFRVRKFKNTSAMRVTFFFWKCSKLDLNFENPKNWKNIFNFWDNSFWKCCYKLSLLRREYLLSAVNMLTNSPKFSISLRDTFSTLIVFTGINKCGKAAVLQISTVFGPVHHVTCGRVLWNRLIRHLSNHVFRSQ